MEFELVRDYKMAIELASIMLTGTEKKPRELFFYAEASMMQQSVIMETY